MKKIVTLFSIFISILSFGQTEFYIHLKSDIDVDKVSVSSFNLSKEFKKIEPYKV